MNKLKKIAGLLLAMVMMVGLSTTALASNYSITITNANVGDTYTAYKILDATVSSDGENVSYTIASDSVWLSLVQNAVDSSGNELFALTSSGTVLNVVPTEYATTTGLTYWLNSVTSLPTGVSPVAQETATATSLTLNVGDAGFYFVTTSLGSVVTLTSATPTANITDKNTLPTPEKKASETGNTGSYSTDDTYAQIGETVYYEVTISNVNDVADLRLVDTLSTGLTFDTITSVKLDGSDLQENTDYTKQTSANGFTITFTTTSDAMAAANNNSTIVVYYTATVNSNAVIYSNANTNTVKLQYGQKYKTESTPQETKTYVYQFNLLKAKSDGTGLEGAKFQLKKGSDVLSFVMEDDNTYRVATQAEINDSGTTTYDYIITTADTMSIKGLDASVAYTLTETEAPAGYNKLTRDITFTIGTTGVITITDNGGSATLNSNTIKVTNLSGSTLPSTGGIGTTIFYIVGSVLVFGAVVLLITRRRMRRAE